MLPGGRAEKAEALPGEALAEIDNSVDLIEMFAALAKTGWSVAEPCAISKPCQPCPFPKFSRSLHLHFTMTDHLP